ncbi:MAG: hypothetical protein IJN42_03680 [Clostridia bacterium]|nr:hypothetical protein [Clostridia bacterium]
MRLNGITIPVDKPQDIGAAIRKKCGKKATSFRILKRSVDARKEPVRFVYNLEAAFDGAPLPQPVRLEVPKKTSADRPIVIGFGPCGMFAALILAKSGLRPLVLERGKTVTERQKDIDGFWAGGPLNPNSNVQFGEGGAGTFSDGKLTTLIGSPLCAEVLETFIECGAPEEIRWLARPHIGTDILRNVVRSMRKKIIEYGGEIRFEQQVNDLVIENGILQGVVTDELLPAHHAILAVGHSARDTMEMLYRKGIHLVPKAFSVGARIEHPQELINLSQYGKAAVHLGAADYKLSYHTTKGRGVYTFCMCPGGLVVGAASEEGGLVTNGMSYHARDAHNANAALLVGIEPADYGDGHPLSGIRFQRELEQAAFQAGGGNYCAPCQRLEDFMAGRVGTVSGIVAPTYRPGVTPAALDRVLPDFVCEAMREALPVFGKRIKGYDMADALLTGPESRTSSPVRITRNEEMEAANVTGLYPAGEGAGYAGGIMSAAVDGIKVALKIIEQL